MKLEALRGLGFLRESCTMLHVAVEAGAPHRLLMSLGWIFRALQEHEQAVAVYDESLATAVMAAVR